MPMTIIIIITFGFHFNRPTFPEITPGETGSPEGLLCKEEPLSIADARFFTGWMPFLSTNQQCQSIERI